MAKTIEQSVNKQHQNTESTFDVGLVGLYSGLNYGTHITNYSLYRVLKDMGYSVLMINTPIDGEIKPILPGLFKTNPYSASDCSKFCKKSDMVQFNKYTNKFLVASDQLFRPWLYTKIGGYPTLEWVNDSKIKAGYAISFGLDYFEGDEELRAYMGYFLKKFDYLSVRENSGLDILKRDFGIENAEYAIDPVFLMDEKHYDKLIDNATVPLPKNKYVLTYLLDKNDKKLNIVQEAAKRLNSEIVFIPNPLWLFIERKLTYFLEDWLNHYKNAEFVVTDSFHGLCMALIFRKQFVFFMNEGRGNARFDTMIDNFGIGSRVIHSADEINEKIAEKFDYDAFDEKLNAYKESAFNYLRKVMTSEKIKNMSDYDFIQKLVSTKNNNIVQKQAVQVNTDALFEQNFKRFIQLYKRRNFFRFKYYAYRIFANLVGGKAKAELLNKKEKYKNLLKIIGEM